ncbi:hypothetical protein FOPG_18696 [Fusarium oxysporum f. sp. conglutinans race 2 54008]|nr:hypothetical protein FOPG_18696 [Fusarium oxysporum f. sp. conglutinans race 2 54008]
MHAKYKVLRQVNSHSYELDVPGRIHPVFHVDLFRPAPQDPLPSQTTDDSQQSPILVDGKERWYVERVLDEKKEGVQKNAHQVGQLRHADLGAVSHGEGYSRLEALGEISEAAEDAQGRRRGVM